MTMLHRFLFKSYVFYVYIFIYLYIYLFLYLLIYRVDDATSVTDKFEELIAG